MTTNMLIKNLLIKFVRRQGEKSVFQTESGAEIVFDEYLLGDKFDSSQNYYLALDSKVLSITEDSQKEILNELIGHDVEK